MFLLIGMLQKLYDDQINKCKEARTYNKTYRTLVQARMSTSAIVFPLLPFFHISLVMLLFASFRYLFL